MTKKLFLVLLIAILLSGSIFAADRVHKHDSGKMLLGINFGTNYSPNIFRVLKDDIPSGNYAATLSFGLTFDYYLFYWLSFNTGALFYSGLYVFYDRAWDYYYGGDAWDFAKWPICITIPLMAHVNIPYVEWLYLGAGVNFNIPVANWGGEDWPYDRKGKFFIGVPIDFGFDFIRPGRGGVRLFFRFTPEFHNKETVYLIGINWQIYNIKLK